MIVMSCLDAIACPKNWAFNSFAVKSASVVEWACLTGVVNVNEFNYGFQGFPKQ